ncbi:MAG TPA: hypothetical protein VF535_01360 [Allosphingosinicella sp.]|jgi:uncharacterized membrane-anchored protein
MKNLRPVAMWTVGAATASLLAFLRLGAAGLVLVAVAGILALVWKFDNWSGSCFMLAILVVIVVAVLLLLIVLMALPRP